MTRASRITCMVLATKPADGRGRTRRLNKGHTTGRGSTPVVVAEWRGTTSLGPIPAVLTKNICCPARHMRITLVVPCVNHPRSTVQRRRHSGRCPRALQAAARLQASRGPSAHHLGLREPLISAVLKASLTLRPSGRLDAWRRRFDASEDDLVRVAARGGRGHGPE